jgi:hypothetical protein
MLCAATGATAEETKTPATSAQRPTESPLEKGLVLWLDARDLTGTQIQLWLDKSPKQHHAKGVNGPKILSDGSGLVRFGEGAASPLTTPALSEGRRDFTVFVVARRTEEQAGGGTWQRLLSPSMIQGVDQKDYALSFSLPPKDGKGGAFPLAVFSRVFRNVDSVPLTIGANLNNRLQADIAELLIYNRSFDEAAEYEAVMEYLTHKWSARAHRGEENWIRTDPFPDALVQSNDALPLIDQANAGHWQRYEPLSDEFNGTALDTTKWWDHNPEWYGRAPALFIPDNIALKDG